MQSDFFVRWMHQSDSEARNWRQIEQSMNLAIASTGASTGHAASTSTGLCGHGCIEGGRGRGSYLRGGGHPRLRCGGALVDRGRARCSPTMRPAITMAVDPRRCSRQMRRPLLRLSTSRNGGRTEESSASSVHHNKGHSNRDTGRRSEAPRKSENVDRRGGS